MSDLIVFEEKSLKVSFRKKEGIQPLLDKIAKEVELFEPDMTSKKGREEIKSIAYKVAQTKTAIDKFGADLVADQKKAIKVVDTERKRSKDFLDALKIKVRKPLTDWEEKESARLARFKSAIDTLNKSLEIHSGWNIDDVKLKLTSVMMVKIDESWSEFELAGRSSKEKAVEHLKSCIIEIEKRDAEKKELEELRRKQAEAEKKENEERIAKEAAEKATQEVAEKAALLLKAEKEKASKKLKAQKEKAEKEAAKAKLEAEKELAYEKKKQALKDQEAAEKKALEEKRASDLEHTKSINNLVLDQMVAVSGITSEQAKKIVIAIAKQQFEHLKIQY